MAILVIGINHKTAPIEIREKFAFSIASMADSLKSLLSQKLADEAVILSTCNRVEIYISTQLGNELAFEKIIKFLNPDTDNKDVESLFYKHADRDCIEHLFKVVCGLDSMVLGETEILGQVKDSYQIALKNKTTGPILNRLFQKAFNVAKKVRSETAIQRGNISVASVAVDLAGKIFSDFNKLTILVLGAGDTSEKTVRALVNKGAKNLMISNRTFENAVQLATAMGGTAVKFEDWPNAAASADIIISSTSAPGFIITKQHVRSIMKNRENRSLLIIDIAVPRDVEPEVNSIDGVFLFNIDELKAITDEYLNRREKEINLCLSIIRQKAEEIASVLNV
jgi:glutamyl-tRNA reductase